MILKSFIERGVRRIRRFVEGQPKPQDAIVPPATIAGLRSKRLQKAANQINQTRFPHAVPGVAGWLSPDEQRTLYALTRYLPGPFLEIGAWAGLSTCTIAMAIRDSRKRKQFFTSELNPSMANFRPHGATIGFFYPVEDTVPRGLCNEELFERDIKPILTSPGGVVGTLTRNLARLGLEQLVDIRIGHFEQVAARIPYSFIFCDAVHDPEEIGQNGPGLRKIATPGTILACHDVTRDGRNEKCLREYVRLGEAFVVDSMLVAEVI